jgi:hypothetical protein
MTLLPQMAVMEYLMKRRHEKYVFSNNFARQRPALSSICPLDWAVSLLLFYDVRTFLASDHYFCAPKLTIPLCS